MFVHLHCHSEASIADGLFGVDRWVKTYVEQGYKAAALTDHGVMTYSIPFYRAMKAAKLIPILGCEFYYVPDVADRNRENKPKHVVLLAKNYEGFQNLLKLSRLSFSEGFFYRPRIGHDWIKQHHEGLICLTACHGGILAAANPKSLPVVWNEFSIIFGEDFYVEFQGHDSDAQREANERLHGLSHFAGFKPIITNDCHYILPEHAKVQALLKQSSYRSKNIETSTSYTQYDSLWLKSPKLIWKAFRMWHPMLPEKFVVEGMKNTQEVMEKCKDLELPSGKRYLPSFRAGRKSDELFKSITTAQLKTFLSSANLRAPKDEYIKRFAKEYQVITKYGLQDYFLVVWDIVRFAKSKGIFTGLGRGSAAGSLISYLLGIVKIDPLEYGLIFERFLNEQRCEAGELPDIDLDFESDRRGEIKQYIFETYGRDRVCEIGTYTRMKLKTALADFGKALGVAAHKEIMSITTKMESDEITAEVEDLLSRDPGYKFAVTEIIGQIKSQSIHPAGMVICSEPIETITPLKTQKTIKSDERAITTQSEDKSIIAQGLMKIDVLGLKEYDIIKAIIQSAPGCTLTVDNYVEQILEQERKAPNRQVWELFQTGQTEGVFQFSSEIMQSILRKMKPDCLNDLIAANALVRPGCLENGWHIQYCERKHGREKVEYPHPDIESSLAGTYGIMVFQENFMEVIHKLGGISLVDSDTIRSALGKKNAEKLGKFRDEFLKGASTKISMEKAENLWRQIEHAAGYTFNKSHSAAYSVLAYISQYLKLNFTPYFWSAHLEWDARKNKEDELLEHKRAALGMGVEIGLPDINESRSGFYVSKGKPVWSFRGIKGVGEKAAAEIEAHQPYSDFENFYTRVNKSKVKFNNMVNLALAGVFDSFGDRKDILRIIHEKKKKSKSYSDEALMMGFYEVMGFFEQKIKTVKAMTGCLTQEELKDADGGETVMVGGMLIEPRRIKTKKGDPMGFGRLIDLDESIDLTFFPSVYAKYRPLIQAGNIIKVIGVKSEYGNRSNSVEVQGLRLA